MNVRFGACLRARNASATADVCQETSEREQNRLNNNNKKTVRHFLSRCWTGLKNKVMKTSFLYAI